MTQNSQQTPSPDGIKEVTKEQFFATVGQRDVNPTPRPGKMYQDGWSRCDWKDRNGRVMGVSLDSEDYPTRSHYYTNLAQGD